MTPIMEKTIYSGIPYVTTHSGMVGAGEYVSLVVNGEVTKTCDLPSASVDFPNDNTVDPSEVDAKTIIQFAKENNALIHDPDAADILGMEDYDTLITPEQYNF